MLRRFVWQKIVCLLSFCLAFSLPLVAHYSERDTEGGRERERAREGKGEEREEERDLLVFERPVCVSDKLVVDSSPREGVIPGPLLL